MKKVKILGLGLIMLCVVGLLFATCKGSTTSAQAGTQSTDKATSTKKVKVGVVVPSADHGWTAGVVWWAQKAINDWKAKDPNVEFVFKTAASAAEMTSVIEDLRVQKIDALVVLPHDSSVTPVVKEVYLSGVFTVVIDRGLTEEAYNVYISGDNAGLGRVSGEWLAKTMGGKGDIVELEGLPVPINKERVDAFGAVIAKNSGMKILDSQPADWSEQKGLTVMENYLQKYPKIDAVFAQDDDVLKGVLQAYKESKRTDIKYFLGGAGSKDIIKIIKDGSDPRILATVTYHPNMAASAVSIGVYGARKEGLPGFYQNTPPRNIKISAELITKENADRFYEPDSPY